VSYHASFGELLHDVVGELFQLDSRIARTVVPFLFLPGKLTAEFVGGRRLTYSSPLRLYLLTSFLYFFVLSLVPASSFNVQGSGARGELTASDREELSEGLKSLRGQGKLGTRVVDRFEAFFSQGSAKMKEQISAGLANKAPKAMFFLLPVFALLLKFLFWRRYYVEHIVFSLHFHSFCFVLLLPQAFWPEHLAGIPYLVAIVYLAIALHRVYRSSWPKTLAKLLGLLVTYGTILGLSIAGMMFATIVWG
jgi:hypothetical protein